MRIFVNVLIVAMVCCVAPGVAGATKTPRGRVTAGHYTIPVPAGVNANAREAFLFTVFPVNPKDTPARIKGKSYRIQTIGFFRWPAESTVPPDGVIHFCGPGGLLAISPPGLPDGVAPRLFSGNGRGRLFALNAASGRFDELPGIMSTFKWSGRFDEVKHSIRITATCNGLTATRTYRLTHRF
jgi:hypothetical protein